MARITKVAGDIKALRIQGARRIAKAAVEALSRAAQKSQARSWGEFYSDLLVGADELASARPTEPMLRNFLEDLLSVARARRGAGVKELKIMLAARQDELLAMMEESSGLIAAHGSHLLQDGARVLVHCHSTTLMSILKAAHRGRKRLEVHCTETRPRYQGRMSALELADAGLDVTIIADSAAGGLIASGKIDVALFGADAITARGELLNKVGTYPIALAAKRAGVKVYSAAELHKFDMKTEGGRAEEIEMRDGAELFDSPAMRGKFARAGVKAHNPAFDLTPPQLIDAFICEKGVVAPREFAALAKKNSEG